MKRKNFRISILTQILLLFASTSYTQGQDDNIYWHIDPKVESCSMVIDRSLTQKQWHRFVNESAAIMSFKVLAPAHTLGKMNFNITIDYGYTSVDQHALAWINTFTHPDEDCPLGDAISIPTLRASFGISDNMDIGGFWTVAPDANYGIVGADFKYAFWQDHENVTTVATRANIVILTGVPDFDLSIYSVDLIASRQIAVFTPYAGLKMSMASATETTSKVNLNQENIFIPQGYAGVSYSIWMLNLAAEYNIASVNTFAFAVGFNL